MPGHRHCRQGAADLFGDLLHRHATLEPIGDELTVSELGEFLSASDPQRTNGVADCLLTRSEFGGNLALGATTAKLCPQPFPVARDRIPRWPPGHPLGGIGDRRRRTPDEASDRRI